MKKYIRSSLLYSPYYEKWKSFLKENVHGDVPEEVLMQTAEYLGSDGSISLYDAFSEACRDCAPKGSELYEDWYNGDLRKYIPSEYVESSTYIECSEYTSENPLLVECPRGPYYVWEEFGTFKGSVNNPNSRIVDARRIHTFDGFDSLDEVVDYVKKYF